MNIDYNSEKILEKAIYDELNLLEKHLIRLKVQNSNTFTVFTELCKVNNKLKQIK